MSAEPEIQTVKTTCHRQAKCPHCSVMRPSSAELLGFEYRPDAEYDLFYCGCRGIWLTGVGMMKTPEIPSTPATPITCHSEKCPVCNGHGTVNYGQLTCKVCQGKCYILVPNEIPKGDT